MVTNRELLFRKPDFRNGRRIFLRLFFLFSACFSFAQTIYEPGDLVGSDRGENSFRVVETPQGLRIIQRLSWLRDENDFRYEVIIEQQDENGTYTQILREDRTENFVEQSLVPGRYRYQVWVYNLLDQLEYATNWAVFSIGRARPPVLDRISPDRFILTEENEPWIMELTGTNFLAESELSLRPLSEEGALILPGEYTASPDGTGGRVVFNAGDLAVGRYELIIRNPGGFEAAGECAVKNRLPFDMSISVSYTPALPIYGYLRDLFNDGIYPLGFSLRAGLLPLPFQWNRTALGFEAAVFWNRLSVTKPDLTAAVHSLGSQVSLLYQYTLFPSLLLGARLGVGPVSVLDLSYTLEGVSQDPFSTWVLSLGGGISAKWLFHPHGFAELGLDYLNVFSVDGPQGFLFPFIGLGWKY